MSSRHTECSWLGNLGSLLREMGRTIKGAVASDSSAARGVIARAGPLDLDDPGTQVGQEHGAVGPGEDAGEIEDDNLV